MIDAEHRRFHRAVADVGAPDVDLGLRSFLLGVLTKVALGLFLAGGIAYVITASPALSRHLFTVRTQGDHTALGLTGAGLALVFSPILALFLFSSGPQTRLRSALLYWSVAATVGASSSAVLLMYTGASIVTTFAAAAAGFGALSLIGYTTHCDLSATRAFLTTGLVGLITSVILNLLLGSAALAFALNVVGAIVFAGLIAYDMQRLKLMYRGAIEGGVADEVATNTGALCLFLDFVNFYQFLLFTFGDRR
jgi:FtsH-binding integral membrane protein